MEVTTEDASGCELTDEIKAWLLAWDDELTPEEIGTQSLASLKAETSTGIPTDEQIAPALPPAEPATGCRVKQEDVRLGERAVHPEYCGPKYDATHETAVKNMQAESNDWAKQKGQSTKSISRKSNPTHIAPQHYRWAKTFSAGAITCTM